MRLRTRRRPLDDEALDELLAFADADLLDHVQRHSDPARVLAALAEIELDQTLRRALHSDADAVAPAADGLDRIRERTAARRSRLRHLTDLFSRALKAVPGASRAGHGNHPHREGEQA